MKYLLLKHYRGGPAPVGDGVQLPDWAPEDVEAHLQFMSDFATRLEEQGEWVDGQALSPEGTFVRSGGPGQPPVTDGPFAESKDLVAGFMMIDVDSYDRAVQLAAELSAAPGQHGDPLLEWIELRPMLTAPPAMTD